jgi:hypothetical protein
MLQPSRFYIDDPDPKVAKVRATMRRVFEVLNDELGLDAAEQFDIVVNMMLLVAEALNCDGSENVTVEQKVVHYFSDIARRSTQ